MSLRYDSVNGFPAYESPFAFYDLPSGSPGKNSMSQVAANMAGLSGLDQINRGQNMVTQCTANANVPNLLPTPASVQLVITAAVAAIQDANAAKQATREAVAAKKAALKEMVVQIMLMGASVESVTGGDPTKILTTGFDIKQTAAD